MPCKEREGYSPVHGARPLRRVISKHLLLPLAKLLLAHDNDNNHENELDGHSNRTMVVRVCLGGGDSSETPCLDLELEWEDPV